MLVALESCVPVRKQVNLVGEMMFHIINVRAKTANVAEVNEEKVSRAVNTSLGRRQEYSPPCKVFDHLLRWVLRW